MHETPQHATPTEQPTITARTVGWALSAATIGSLLLGLVVVEYFGRVSDRPQVESEPEPIVSQKPVAPEPPTVLRSMGGSRDADGLQPGFDWLAPPATTPATNDAHAPRMGSAASLPPGLQ